MYFIYEMILLKQRATTVLKDRSQKGYW